MENEAKVVIGYIYDHEIYCNECDDRERKAFAEKQKIDPRYADCDWDDQPVRVFPGMVGYGEIACCSCRAVLVTEAENQGHQSPSFKF